MSAFVLHRLRDLHQSMKQQGRLRCMFPFERNGHLFNVFFVADVDPYVLMFARVGDPAYFDLTVAPEPEYAVSTFLDREQYRQLFKLLGLQYDPKNPFSPFDFLRDLNAAVPSHVGRAREIEPSDLVPFRARDLEEPDRPYYVKWYHHSDPSISDVTDKNLEKTRWLLGEAAYERCREFRISSVWTDDRSKAKQWAMPKHKRSTVTAH